MAGNKQSPLERTAQFQPPWRELQPNGELGAEYGPSPSTLARRIKAFRMWTWRPESHEERRRQEALLISEWFNAGGDAEASAREHDVFNQLYVYGASTREAARQLGISRDTVREYRKRLLRRMEAYSGD